MEQKNRELTEKELLQTIKEATQIKYHKKDQQIRVRSKKHFVIIFCDEKNKPAAYVSKLTDGKVVPVFISGKFINDSIKALSERWTQIYSPFVKDIDNMKQR